MLCVSQTLGGNLVEIVGNNFEYSEQVMQSVKEFIAECLEEVEGKKIRLKELEVFSVLHIDNKRYVKLHNNLIMDEDGNKSIVDYNILCNFDGENYLHGIKGIPRESLRESESEIDRLFREMKECLPRVWVRKNQEEQEKKYEKKTNIPSFSDLNLKVRNRQKIRIKLKTDYRAFSKKNKPALLRGQYIGFASVENGILTGITVLFKGYQYRVAVQDIQIVEVTKNMVRRDFIEGFIE